MYYVSQFYYEYDMGIASDSRQLNFGEAYLPDVANAKSYVWYPTGRIGWLQPGADNRSRGPYNTSYYLQGNTMN